MASEALAASDRPAGDEAPPARRRGVALLDDRWPDRFAAATFAFAALVVVAAFVCTSSGSSLAHA